MQNKIQILMPDRTIVSENATYLSFIKLLDHIGFEKVADLNLRYKKYPIITRTPYGAYLYKQANAFWYVLAKWPTIVAAQYINKIADELDLCIECDVVPR